MLQFPFVYNIHEMSKYGHYALIWLYVFPISICKLDVICINSESRHVIVTFSVYIVVACGLIGLGIWLTIHGVDNELRDFLIIGPGTLGIGVILIIFILFMVIRDACVYNQVASIKVRVRDEAISSGVTRQRANSTTGVPATSSTLLARNSITMLTTGNNTRLPGNSSSPTTGENQGTDSPPGPVLSEEEASSEPGVHNRTVLPDTVPNSAAENHSATNTSQDNVISTTL